MPVGQQPVGLALIGDAVAIGRRLQPIAAAPHRTSDLAIVDTRAALTGLPALHGYAPAGQFPRDLAPIPGQDTVVVSNYDSRQLELANLAAMH